MKYRWCCLLVVAGLSACGGPSSSPGTAGVPTTGASVSRISAAEYPHECTDGGKASGFCGMKSLTLDFPHGATYGYGWYDGESVMVDFVFDREVRAQVGAANVQLTDNDGYFTGWVSGQEIKGTEQDGNLALTIGSHGLQLSDAAGVLSGQLHGQDVYIDVHGDCQPLPTIARVGVIAVLLSEYAKPVPER